MAPGTTKTPGALCSLPSCFWGTPPSAIVNAVPEFIWGMSVEGGQRTVKEVAMTKTLLIVAALIAGIGFAVAQDQGNKSEAATPAPPAQQNAPPDKVAPGPLNSPNAVPPDAKAEASAPALKMDSGAKKKLPASEDATSGQDTTRSRP